MLDFFKTRKRKRFPFITLDEICKCTDTDVRGLKKSWKELENHETYTREPLQTFPSICIFQRLHGRKAPLRDLHFSFPTVIRIPTFRQFGQAFEKFSTPARIPGKYYRRLNKT